MSLAEPLADQVVSDQSLRRTLDRDGFAVLEQITDAEDIGFILAQFKTMVSQQGQINPEWVFDLGDDKKVSDNTKILEINHATTISPALRQSRFFHRAWEVSRNVLGPDTDLLFDHVIIKPALSQTVTAWHQDNAYTRRITFTGRRLHWWLPLQAVSLHNSCMQFIAGSHRGPLLPHRLRSPQAHARFTDLPSGAIPTVCPLPAGGATIHLAQTLHFTGPNDSEAPRYAWVVQFGIKGWRPYVIR
jgi:ectoine hydroxylase-related dioxygenase (phytanoyl-CoA dioxygenase family)